MRLCVHFTKERGDSLGKNGFYLFEDVIGNPISASGIEQKKSF